MDGGTGSADGGVGEGVLIFHREVLEGREQLREERQRHFHRGVRGERGDCFAGLRQPPAQSHILFQLTAFTSCCSAGSSFKKEHKCSPNRAVSEDPDRSASSAHSAVK
jgi:hypothetical protein